MEKALLWILYQVKNGMMDVNTAERQIHVLFGKKNSAVCRLDRIPTNCCIVQNTSLKNCADCGHYIK